MTMLLPRRCIQRRTLLLFVLSIVPLISSGQGLTNEGREFYIGLPAPSILSQSLWPWPGGKNPNSGFGAYAIVASHIDDTVFVSYFDPTGLEQASRKYSIRMGQMLRIPLDRSMFATGSGEVPEFRTLHLAAHSPVNVIVYTEGSCAGSSYLALPTHALGREYVVQSYQDNEGGVGGVFSSEDAAGFFQVIAVRDSTVVTIVPTSTTKLRHTGVNCGQSATGVPHPFMVTLSRGQAYTVRGAADGSGCSIGGSTIVASFPVAVLAGHENAFTDGSDPQPGNFEGRNFMIEQMLPRECLDTGGYVTIPFIDSQQPVNAGEGDQIVVRSAAIPAIDTVGQTTARVELNNGTRLLTCYPYDAYENGITNWTSPISIECTNGTPISVVQLDLRAQGGGPPYPAPEMMTIIPHAQWRTDYTVVVPPNPNDSLATDFLNVICRATAFNADSIWVSTNGGQPISLRFVKWALRRKFTSIPDYPDLVGYSFQIPVGVHQLSSASALLPQRSGSAFVAYSYGMRYYDPVGRFIDAHGATGFYEYAAPAGTRLQVLRAPKTKITATVERECNPWRVCVHDSGGPGAGIRVIELLSVGECMDSVRITERPNASFDTQVDRNQIGEILLGGTTTDYCFDVRKRRWEDSSNAIIAIYDRAGAVSFVDLRAPAMRLATGGTFHVLHENGGFDAGTCLLDSEQCGSVYLINPSDGDADFSIAQIALSDQIRNYSLAAPLPTLPLTLHVGDSVRLDVCFHPRDTGSIDEQVQLWTTCNAFYTYKLTGFGSSGVLVADDHEFETTTTGSKRCASVLLHNNGSRTLRVLAATLSDSVNFFIDTAATSLVYPIPIAAGSSVAVSVCYSPTNAGVHSATIEWQTDLSADGLLSSKPSTVLSGSGQSDAVGQLVEQPPNAIHASIVDERLTLHLRDRLEGPCELRLHDLLGRVVASWRRQGIQSGETLAVPPLAEGAYVLIVSCGRRSRSCMVFR